MGLLDGSPFDSSGTLSPQWAGILGSLAALSQSPGIAPQPASRLPLARATPLSILGAEAGGYLQGRQASAQLGGTQAETGAKNLATMQLLNRYNLTAPIYGVPQISISDLQNGKFDGKTMQTAAQSAEQDAQAAPQSQNPIGKLFSGILGGSTPQAPAPAAAPGPQMAQAAPQMQAQSPSPPMMGGGGASAPVLAPPASAQTGILSGPPQSGSLFGDRFANASPMAQMFFQQDMGIPLTKVQQELAAQNINPNDPRFAALRQMELRKTAGAEYQNVRQGGALVDPITGKIVAKVPVLGEGVQVDENGNAETVPGYIGAAKPVSQMEAEAKAGYEPMEVHDAQGNTYIVPKSALGGGGRGLAGKTLTAPTQQAAAPTPQSTLAPKAPTLANAKLSQVIKQSDIPAATAPAGAFFGAPNAGTSEIQKLDAERLGSYNKQASEGQKIYQDLKMLSGTLDRGLNTNKLAPLWSDLSNVAQGLGLPFPKNYDPNDAGEFDKVSTDLVFAALKQLPGQPRVTEIQGLQKANPNLTLPRATNAAIMHGILANQEWMDKRSELATEYMSKYRGAPLGTFDAAFNKSFPLSDVTDQVFAAARQAGWRFPGDQNPGQAPSQSPLPQGAKVIGSYQGKQVIEMPDGSRHVQQ